MLQRCANSLRSRSRIVCQTCDTGFYAVVETGLAGGSRTETLIKLIVVVEIILVWDKPHRLRLIFVDRQPGQLLVGSARNRIELSGVDAK